MQLYPERFKKAAVKKALEPGIRHKDLAIKLGISIDTLSNWKKLYMDELIEEVEKDFFDQIQPEEEDEIDIDKLIAEYDRKDMSAERVHQEQTIDKILERGTLPSEYTPQEKYIMINKIRNMKQEEVGVFLRRAGIRSEHIKSWEEELLSMAKKNSDMNDYIKKLEEKTRKLEKQLKESEREKKELKVLIGLKKKYRDLFKEDEED